MALQASAIAFANSLISVAAQMKQLRVQINELTAENAQQGYTTVLSALNTAPLNADGTLGTADGSPNTAHPIDTRVYSSLTRAVSETLLSNMIADMADYLNFLNNAAVSTKNRANDVDGLAS